MEALPTLAHSDYENICPIFVKLMDPLFVQYQDCLKTGNTSKMSELETKLAWLIYMYGSCVGKRVGANNSDEMELIDGEISGRILKLSFLIHQRLQTDKV